MSGYVLVYTIGCPRCKILEKKLAQKNIHYMTMEDEEVMRKMGLTSLPMMSVNAGPLMTYKEAIDWVNE